MELGIGTITYELGGIPLSAAVDRIHSHGVKYVDVLAFGDFNPMYLSEEAQKEIADKMKGYGMRASSVVTCANTDNTGENKGNLATGDPKEREEALEFLKCAARLSKRLGGKHICIGAGVGNVDYYLPRREATQNSVAAVKEFCRWAEQEGMYVALELEPEGLYVLNSIQQMKDFIDAVGEENCCANIDIGHMHILRENPEGLGVIKDKIMHAHLSDNGGFAHTNSVVGSGNIKFEWFVETLHQLGIDRNCERFGDVAVAGLEIGEPGEYITDCDLRISKSIGNILTRVPLLRAGN